MLYKYDITPFKRDIRVYFVGLNYTSVAVSNSINSYLEIELEFDSVEFQIKVTVLTIQHARNHFIAFVISYHNAVVTLSLRYFLKI